MKTKYLTAALVGIIAVGIAVFILWRKPETQKEIPFPIERTTTTETSQNDNTPPQSDTVDAAPTVRVRDMADTKGPKITYSGGRFSPDAIDIKRAGEDSSECLITILNQSAENVVVRLGPPPGAPNRGFQYDAIPPGATGLIDPRYRGLDDAAFFNSANPSATFRVRVLPTCAL